MAIRIRITGHEGELVNIECRTIVKVGTSSRVVFDREEDRDEFQETVEQLTIEELQPKHTSNGYSCIFPELNDDYSVVLL